MVWTSQNSFTGGIISQKLFNRLDLRSRDKALSQLVNFKVLPHGGVLTRSGTKYIKEIKTSADTTRIITFEFSQEEAYALELGDKYIRFYSYGSAIPIELTSPWAKADIFELDFTQTADILTVFHGKYKPRRIKRLSDDGTSWEIENIAFIDGPYLPVNTDEDLTLDCSASTGSITITASKDLFTSTDVGRLLRIWDETAGEWSWGDITAVTSATEVTLTVVEGNMPTAPTDFWRIGRYSETSGFPSTGMVYEQRMGMAGATKYPQDIDLSQTGKFEHFQTALDGILLSSDAVGFSLYSAQVDNIQWLRPTGGGLAIGTSGGPWLMTGTSGPQDAITPASVNARKQGVTTSHDRIKPVQLDNAVLFLDKAARRIHEFAYNWEEDGYRSPDMTILAEDLFTKKKVVDMAASRLSRILWVVLDDGLLLGFTYMRDEEVTAWHVHKTDGKFKSVAVVPEGEVETVYCIVERTVNDVVYQYVEYFEQDFEAGEDTVDFSDAYMFDCGITSSGQVITGLDHIEGKVVQALADGQSTPPQTVTGGSIDIGFSATKVHVGIFPSYSGEIPPFEIKTSENDSTLGLMKDIGRAIISVTSSYGCLLGRDEDNMQQVRFNEDLVFGEPPKPFTGSKLLDTMGGQPERDCRIRFEQDIPLPLMLNAIVLDLIITEE